MSKLSMLPMSLAVTLSSALAFADEVPGPSGPPFGPYGYHPMMWGHGWGWGGGFGFHPFLAIFTLIGLIMVVMWVVRLISHGSLRPVHHGFGRGGNRALEILDERFAKGEIGKDEYQEKRKLIGD